MKQLLLAVLFGLVFSTPTITSQTSGFNQFGKPGKELSGGGAFIAHSSLPLNSKAKVVNVETGKEVEVTVIRHIPASTSRIADISKSVWERLELTSETNIRIYTNATGKPPPRRARVATPEPVAAPTPEPAPVVVAPPPPEPVPAPLPVVVVVQAPPPDPAPAPVVVVVQAPPPEPAPAPVVVAPPPPEPAPAPVVIAPPPPEPAPAPVVVAPPEPAPAPVVVAPPEPAPAPVVAVAPPPPPVPREPPTSVMEIYNTAYDTGFDDGYGEGYNDGYIVSYKEARPIVIYETQPPKAQPAPVAETRRQQTPPVTRQESIPPALLSETWAQVAKPEALKAPPAAANNTPPAQPAPVAGTLTERPQTIVVNDTGLQTAQPVTVVDNLPSAYQPVWPAETRTQTIPAIPREVVVSPALPNPRNGRTYLLQVGAFASPDTAAAIARQLDSAGFRVAYESAGSMHRVFVRDIPSAMVYDTAQRLGVFGIEEVLVRE